MRIGVAVFGARFRTGLLFSSVEALALPAVSVAVVAVSRPTTFEFFYWATAGRLAP